MNKRNATLFTASFLGVVALCIPLFEHVGNRCEFSMTKASDAALTLSNGCIGNLTSTYSDNTFVSATPSNNEISWEYKYGKSSNGLIELGKESVGLPNETNYYIGNTSPITSISEITVDFEGSDVLYLYGSSNQEDYYLVDLVEANVATERVAGYLYFRLVNGNQYNTSVTISSIHVSYSCSEEDYSDEPIDISSNSILQDSSSALSYDNEHYLDGFQSSKSLKIAHADNSTRDWVLSLGHDYTGKDIKKSVLTFYVNSENNADYDTSHAYSRLLIYPAKGTSRINSSYYYQTQNIVNGSGWTKITVSFNSMSEMSDSAVINSLYIRSVYATTGLNIDQMHLNLGGEDLDSELINTYEYDDQITTDISYSYGKLTSSYEYNTLSINSVRSHKITIDADWRMWTYDDTGMNGNMDGYTLSFDIKFDDIITGKTSASATLNFGYSGYRYSISIIRSGTGVTYTTLSNGWAHVAIDIDEVVSGLAESTDTKTTYGINVGYARTIYIDNLHIDDGSSPQEASIALTYPSNASTISFLPEAALKYRNDFYASRNQVENDYVLDVSEVNTTDHSPRIVNYKSGSRYDDYFTSIYLKYRIYNYVTSTVDIHLSLDSEFSNETVFSTNELKTYPIKNLFRNTTYYWKVMTSDEVLSSDVFSFTTEDTPRFINAGSVHNVRDMGGYLTKSGKRIRQGLIFRGQELNLEAYEASGSHVANLDDENLALFNDILNIGVEIDLRGITEIKDNDPDVSSNLGANVDYINTDNCPAYKYVSQNTAKLYKLEPVFRAMLNADTRHVYVHCWGGADRTGTVCFILGGFLGMSFTDLLLDYEFTTFSKNYRPRDESYNGTQSFPEFIEQLYENNAGYDESGNHDIEEICTNILLGAGLSESELSQFKSMMLED